MVHEPRPCTADAALACGNWVQLPYSTTRANRLLIFEITSVVGCGGTMRDFVMACIEAATILMAVTCIVLVIGAVLV